ncbi:MAG: VOC family protein [Thermomicrobiales bacterium]
MIAARLSIVTLGVEDMSLMRAFYRSLGWPEQSSANDEHAMFLTGGGVLALFPLDELARDANTKPPNTFDGFRGFTLACNLESREAVDLAFETLREAGAEIVKEPEEVFWGGYSGYFIDPEENYWEVAHNPFVTFDERGGLIASE